MYKTTIVISVSIYYRSEENVQAGNNAFALDINRILHHSINVVVSFLHPSGWRCEVCDLQENIWMNLTDGKVLCGRRYFDGSGGNNHALLHFQETGYPLAVKLGTITPDGAGKPMETLFSVVKRRCFHTANQIVPF